MYNEKLRLDDIFGRLNVRLINYESNKEDLEDIVFRPFLDLAIVPTIIKTDGYDVSYDFVSKSMLEKWNTDMDFIIGLSIYNSNRINGVRFFPMFEYVKNLGLLFGELEPDGVKLPSLNDEMYVLTNNVSYYGASSILYDNMLKSISGFFKADFYVIPSSIHEVLIYSAECPLYIPEYTKQMIEEINSNVLTEKEFLSDSLYIYRTEKESLEIMM